MARRPGVFCEAGRCCVLALGLHSEPQKGQRGTNALQLWSTYTLHVFDGESPDQIRNRSRGSTPLRSDETEGSRVNKRSTSRCVCMTDGSDRWFDQTSLFRHLWSDVSVWPTDRIDGLTRRVSLDTCGATCLYDRRIGSMVWPDESL